MAKKLGKGVVIREAEAPPTKKPKIVIKQSKKPTATGPGKQIGV